MLESAVICGRQRTASSLIAARMGISVEDLKASNDE